MRALLPFVPLVALAACGARTPLDVPFGTGGDHDAGSVAPGTPCPTWTPVHAAVQVSDTPSIMGLQTALATSSGVLVGYADIQFPPVDPSWQARQVGYDGRLGAAVDVLPRDTSQLGWTPVSFAQAGDGHVAAVASDQADGLLFKAIDQAGGTAGPVVRSSGDTGRAVLSTRAGYTVLRNPFDMSGGVPAPVSLSTLDSTGHAGPPRQLVPASAQVDGVSRVGYGDDTFLLVWATTDACPGCRTMNAQHMSAIGDSLAPAVVVHAFGDRDFFEFAIAASATGFLATWLEQGDGSRIAVMAASFDVDGNASGAPSQIALVPGPNAAALALGTAPGGDLVAAWASGLGNDEVQLTVQSISAAGAVEGAATQVGTAVADVDETLAIAASTAGAVLAYESDPDGNGTQVYAIPLRCTP